MTRDDIIRMAKEAGWARPNHVNNPWSVSTDALERFAALVAAAEREACAKVAESYEPICDTCPRGVSNAIRARSET